MKKTHNIKLEEFILQFRDLIKSLGLKNSDQREYVLKVLFESTEHLSAEEILQQVRDRYNIAIGTATVYRIISFLEEINIIHSILIEGKESKVYEINLLSHHDHLVCTKCHKIVEFFSTDLEKQQEKIAQEKGFKLESHTMILYGICPECQNANNND